MNSGTARQVVITSLAITAALAIAKQVSEAQAPNVPRVLIGAFVAGIVLTFGAEAVPSLAASIAALILVGAIVNSGPHLWGAIANTTKPKAAK